MNNLAPIVLFVYNRPWHTQQTLEALAKNELASASVLYIFADGPKVNADKETIEKIKETRACLKMQQWCKEVIIVERENNLGLANSIITGVTEIVNKYGKVIVLEDDLVLSPYFLLYMNDSLVRYKFNDKVGQIGACNFFACGKKYPSTFFLPIPDCWGWATWKNRWDHFNPDSVELLYKLKEQDLINRFNVYGSYDMEGMLKMQIDGKVDSWAIRWQAICIINNWLILYPNPSLTNHIGSKEATHVNSNILPPLCKHNFNFKTIEVIENPEVVKAMKKGYAGTGDYYGNNKPANKNWITKVILKILKTFLKIFMVQLILLGSLRSFFRIF